MSARKHRSAPAFEEQGYILSCIIITFNSEDIKLETQENLDFNDL